MDSLSASTPSKPSLGDLVAEATLSLYPSLKPSSPTHLPIRNGALEWTILSSVSLVLPAASSDGAPKVIPISLGTGTKTTPYENLKGTPGDVLHDLHAESLARRGARRWLAQRIAVEARWTKQRQEGQHATQVLLDGLPLLLQRRADDQKWHLREGIKVWWYVSTLPCGECSSPHLARRRAKEDNTCALQGREALNETRSTPPSHGDTPHSQSGAVLRGRQVVDEGLARPRLRTVPGRPDAPPSLCHSCTDKLLLWSLLGWQGAALSRLATGKMPIDGLVVGASEEDLRQDSGQELLLKEIKRGLDIRERCSDGGAELTRRLKMAGLSDSLEPPTIELTHARLLQSQECVRERAKAMGMRLEEPTVSIEAAATGKAAASVAQTQPTTLIPAWESSSYVRPTWLDVKSGGKQASDSVKLMATAIARVAKLEKLVYGIKQGASARRSSNRLLPDGRYAPLYGKSRSKVCKLEHFLLMRDLADELEIAVPQCTYAELKGKGNRDDPGAADDSKAEWYRRCKALLRGETFLEGLTWQERDAGERAIVDAWLQQVSLTSGPVRAAEGDEGSSVEGVQTTIAPDEGGLRDGLVSKDIAPLQGWLTTPRSLEAFDSEGAWQ